jgi:hypothetical protein
MNVEGFWRARANVALGLTTVCAAALSGCGDGTNEKKASSHAATVRIALGDAHVHICGVALRTRSITNASSVRRH